MFSILKSKNIHIRTIGARWRRKSVTTCTRDCRSNPTQDFFFYTFFWCIYTLTAFSIPIFCSLIFWIDFGNRRVQLGLVKDQGSNAMLRFTFLLAWVTHSLRGVLKDTYTFVISFPFISFHFSWPVSDTSLLLSEPLKLIASVYKGLFGDFQVPFLFLGNYPVSGSCSNR